MADLVHGHGPGQLRAVQVEVYVCQLVQEGLGLEAILLRVLDLIGGRQRRLEAVVMLHNCHMTTHCPRMQSMLKNAIAWKVG